MERLETSTKHICVIFLSESFYDSMPFILLCGLQQFFWHPGTRKRRCVTQARERDLIMIISPSLSPQAEEEVERLTKEAQTGHQDKEREFAKREGELVAQITALGAEADKSRKAEKEAQTQVDKTDVTD